MRQISHAVQHCRDRLCIGADGLSHVQVQRVDLPAVLGKRRQKIVHLRHRRALYTPGSSHGHAAHLLDLSRYTGHRETEGKFDDGENFWLQDYWFPNGAPTASLRRQEHKPLEKPWTGHTLLRIDGPMNVNVEAADTAAEPVRADPPRTP